MTVSKLGMQSVLAAVVLLLGVSRDGAAVTLDEHLANPKLLLAAACPLDDSILLPKVYFTVCYNKSWRIPRWVTYHLTAVDLEGDVARTEDYREDQAIPERPDRSLLSDYVGSGYHRGQMAPADAFDRSVHAMSTTFLLSNMAPQTPSLNSGKWRSLESAVQKVINGHRGVWVVTGNLFAEEEQEVCSDFNPICLKAIDPLKRENTNKHFWVNGKGRVAVPTHSFKAILVARDSDVFTGYGFIMPNQRERLPLQVEGYQVSIDLIEHLANGEFFSALAASIQESIEGNTPPWPPKRRRRQ